MRRGDVYADYIFAPGKPYPYENKPMPLVPASATIGTALSSASTGSKKPANADTNKSNGGM
jgi:hypothetical protein